MSRFDLSPPHPERVAEITSGLTAEERRVLLNQGTEPPFCGGLLAEKRAGTFCCRLCGLPLFRAEDKFDSGTGWPSFSTPFDDEHVEVRSDESHGMQREEVVCVRCRSHLGHVFPDGPAPTGQRYCLNSVSLQFVSDGEAAPDPLNRGETFALAGD